MKERLAQRKASSAATAPPQGAKKAEPAPQKFSKRPAAKKAAPKKAAPKKPVTGGLSLFPSFLFFRERDGTFAAVHCSSNYSAPTLPFLIR